MGADATLLLIALTVPLVLGSLFALAFGFYMGVLGPDGGTAMMRHAPFLYAGFLMIPLGVLFALDGVSRLGVWFAPPLGTDAVLIVLGIALGALLFSMELRAVSALHRLLRRDGGVRAAVEGGSASLNASGLAGAPIVFVVIIISAGEEIIWRGFLLDIGQSVWSLTPAIAVLLAAVAFGVNHWYFGLQNVVLKTLSGLAWGALAVISATLWPVVVSHTTFSLATIVRLKRQARDKRGDPIGARDPLRTSV